MRGITLFLLIVSFSSLNSQTITLRDTTNQYDYIIITVPEFVSACEPFKQHKETIRGFETLIVDTTQIFAEFDSSSTPQDKIRDFISFAGTFWKEPTPKFFLLIGNVTAIPNFLVQLPGQLVNFPSDFFYSRSIYDDDSTTAEFYVGRIPCNNQYEINNFIAKVVEYESDPTILNWMNNNLFICEDDVQFGFLDAALEIGEYYLPEFIRAYYIVDDSNSIYYGNKDSICNAINERGCSILWFEGHSSDSFFISREYFSINDLSGLNNTGKYYLTIFVATQHSIIDSNTNLTKEMLIRQNAGSLGGIVFTGPSYWGIGKAFQRIWAQRLYDPSI